MMRRALIALVILLSGCALTPEQLRVAFHSANAADLATTEYALDRGCVEANPYLGSHPSDGAVAAYAVLQSVIYEGLYRWVRDNRPNERLAFGRMFLAVKLIGPVNNAYQIGRGCN